jgi:hypothetical protein
MPSKDAKSKVSKPDSKTSGEQDTVYAGGNPGFDERKPTSSNKPSDTVHTGGNPHFDERRTGSTKSGSG